ncbi:MAG: hypothetical protein Q8867_07640 [Bacteroidota bacterium]|nr:hypothetical protein [Bacteroidota bacterium]
MNLKSERKHKKHSYIFLFIFLLLTITGLAWSRLYTFSPATFFHRTFTGSVFQQKSSQGDTTEYNKIIRSADSYFSNKDYLNAKASYQMAIELRPNDEYAKNRLKQAMELLRSQKAQNTLYDVAVANADQLFEAKEYEKAKEAFENASKILPGEKYPKDRINEIIKIQTDLKTNDEMYSKAITQGDKFYNGQEYSAALQEYQKASGYKPDEKYPKDRIKELTGILADLKVKDEKYRKFITSADKLYDQSVFNDARIEYQNASNVKPDEAYPKERIKAIDDLLAGQKKIAEDYDHFINVADSFYINKKYIQAKSGYQQALKLKPGESYPRDMVAKSDEFITAQLADEKTRNEAYGTSIENADKLYVQKNYDQARTEYQNALSIKPEEKYPKERISAIETILSGIAQEKATEANFQRLIAHADSLLALKSYTLAKADYSKALEIKPKDPYPKSKILEIERTLGEIAAAKNRDEQYESAVAAGDKLMDEKSYSQAKTRYQSALKIKPDESYPKGKIAIADSLLANLAHLKELDDQYNTSILKADKLFASKSWEDARSEYLNAGNLKPEEKYPKDKVTEIDKILAGIAENKTKEENYQKILSDADKLLADKSYTNAKEQYSEALKIKPGEKYPQDKIAEIDKITGQIAAAKALDEQYTSAIALADKLLQDKSYEPSRAQYQKALDMKPSETYPKTKISDIDKILEDIRKQKELNDQYAGLITEGDKLFGDKSWNSAKDKYNAAIALKPDEQYPKGKLAEIDKVLLDVKALDDKYNATITNADKLLASKTYDKAKDEYTNAGNLKPDEKYPKAKIEEINGILSEMAHQKEVDDQYQNAIAKADQLMAAKSYIEAKTEYTNAVNLKPKEDYPKTKIAAIDKIIADQKAQDDKYNASIEKADKLLADKLFNDAKTEYLNAGKLKPGEQYPQEKITEIEKALAEIERQKAIQIQYQASLDKADRYFKDKSYLQARTEYSNAGTIKPDEQYPKDKIVEIESILAELKAKDDAYKASIDKADQLFNQKSWEDARNEYQNASSIKPEEKYPGNKMAEINKILTDLKGKKQTFDELVNKGNTLFGQNDLYKAKETYQQALTIFPDEDYPKSRISRITTMVDSIYRANKGLYDKAIGEADQAFNSLIFNKAIDSYTEALSYLPMENYPKEMIGKIKKIISENVIVDVLKDTKTISSGSEERFSFTPSNMASRKNNYFYIKIRNLSDKPFNVLVRYGKDKQINGGAILRNLAGDGKIYDRLVSVRDQDPWYREDNNWISLIPQGGDIEVSFIQISHVQ